MPLKDAEWLEIEGCSLHNLKDVTLRIPRARFTVVTGPSGAGKTSLVTGTLGPAVREALGASISPEERACWKSTRGLDSVRALYQVDQCTILPMV